jgi:hypothetical protein
LLCHEAFARSTASLEPLTSGLLGPLGPLEPLVSPRPANLSESRIATMRIGVFIDFVLKKIFSDFAF